MLSMLHVMMPPLFLPENSLTLCPAGTIIPPENPRILEERNKFCSLFLDYTVQAQYKYSTADCLAITSTIIQPLLNMLLLGSHLSIFLLPSTFLSVIVFSCVFLSVCLTDLSVTASV